MTFSPDSASFTKLSNLGALGLTARKKNRLRRVGGVFVGTCLRLVRSLATRALKFWELL